MNHKQINFKSVKLYVEKPTFKQWLIVVQYNFLLWLAIRTFRDDEKRLKEEIKDIAASCFADLHF